MKVGINSLFSLDKKVAVVTGAARGNGRSIAEGFLQSGATVYFIDILKKTLMSVKNDVKNNKARFITADITDFSLIRKVMENIYNREGRIDVLVNNAAITLPESSDTYTDNKWEKTYLLDLKTPFKLSQLVNRYMRRKSGGVIINITSLGSELGFSNNPAYVAFKGGLKQLTKALAKDWARYGIRVNNLGLGYFRTEMTRKSWADKSQRRKRTERIMLGRWGESSDLVGPAIFLASEASKYITGQDLYVDGGWLANGI
ncbi:MAG: SDR family oxidoreductase [Elusimicrobia bacterium]|nr:SDR family oxidoreductase [Elusimicrobiota bacterium]